MLEVDMGARMLLNRLVFGYRNQDLVPDAGISAEEAKILLKELGVWFQKVLNLFMSKNGCHGLGANNRVGEY